MTTRQTIRISLTIFFLAFAAWQQFHKTQIIQRPVPQQNTSGQVAGVASTSPDFINAYIPDPVSKSTGCISSNGLPDHTCTPGAISSAVTQENIQSTICITGYTKTVRPSVTYTDKLKKQQMLEYGYTGSTKNFEEDHLISLELGGSPTDPANLWPESYAPVPGAREKDKVENYLHDQICSGKLPLAEAQKEIATDWLGVFQTLENVMQTVTPSDTD